MKALKIITAVLALCLVGLIVYAVTSYHDETKVEHDERADFLYKQKGQILSVLGQASLTFSNDITLIENTDSDGNPYYVGEIGPDLGTYLDNLVDAYNADPETTKPITLEELRYCLTDGLAEATEPNKVETSFRHFLKWCSMPVDIMHNDGTLKMSNVKMFDYAKDDDDFRAGCYVVIRPKP